MIIIKTNTLYKLTFKCPKFNRAYIISASSVSDAQAQATLIAHKNGIDTGLCSILKSNIKITVVVEQKEDNKNITE